MEDQRQNVHQTLMHPRSEHLPLPGAAGEGRIVAIVGLGGVGTEAQVAWLRVCLHRRRTHRDLRHYFGPTEVNAGESLVSVFVTSPPQLFP